MENKDSFLTARPQTQSLFTPTRTVIDPTAVPAPQEPTEQPADSGSATPDSSQSPSERLSPTDVKKAADLIKLERRLAKRQAEIDAMSSKAEKLQKAFSSPDVAEQLREMGYDPQEAYASMTKAALDKLKKEPNLTPEQRENKELKQQVESYKAAVDKITSDMNSEREMQAHQRAMNEQVAPIFKENPNQYAVLTKTFGSQDMAIAKVYEECIKHYYQTGQVVDPKIAAQEMNNFYKQTYLESLKAAREIDDFKDMFRQDDPSPLPHAANNAIEYGGDSYSKALSQQLDKPAQSDFPKSTTLSSNTTGSSSSKPVFGKVDHLAKFLKEKGIAG
jgi:hypothetical protein